MTPAPNDLSLTFNLPTLSAAEPKKKKPEAASEPPQKVSAPPEAPVKDPQPRVEESPTVKKPETQQIPPSPPLPTDDDSASKVKGKSPNEKYNLSIDQDLIPRIRWAVQKETGYVYKQGYIYLVAVEEVPLKDIERYLDAYNRNLSTVPELPKVTVRLGNRHAVPAAPSLPPKKVADVDALAKKLGISRSRYFATALRIWLDQHDMMPPAKEHLAENLQQYISSMGLYVPPADLQRLAKKARVSENSASKNS
jgi:hypothetical protein